MPNLPWTAAQDEQLRALARANTPTRDIAARMARTPEAVFQRAHELGVTTRRGEAPYSTRQRPTRRRAPARSRIPSPVRR